MPQKQDAGVNSQMVEPCPFCAKPPVSKFYGDEDGGYYSVECQTGGGHYAGAHCETEDEAIAAWNSRAAIAPDDRLREAAASLAEKAREYNREHLMSYPCPLRDILVGAEALSLPLNKETNDVRD